MITITVSYFAVCVAAVVFGLLLGFAWIGVLHFWFDVVRG